MSSPPDFQLLPFQHQSGDFSFTEWISILTLCLAPLIAHIIGGAPEPSYLCPERPKWHDRICHFNPTSILWRYALIADRRIRARRWRKEEVAATNAVFWTSRGWNGSEAMVEESLPFLTLRLEHTRIKVFSREMIMTAVLTLQGTQAIISIVAGYTSETTNTSSPTTALAINAWLGVDLIFFPLAFIGLMRLSCALWLTNDFVYTTRHIETRDPYRASMGIASISRLALDDLQTTETVIPHIDAGIGYQGQGLTLDTDSQQRLMNDATATVYRFRSTSYWGSRIFRMAFPLPMLGLFIVVFLFLMPVPGYITEPSVTSFLTIVFYLFFIGVTLLIYSFYSFNGHTTTIIPCITKTWYKAYTLILMALALTLLIISAIETGKTACGTYTSAPLWSWEAYQYCISKDVMPFGSRFGDRTYGLASSTWLLDAEQSTNLSTKELWVFNFTGICLGELHDNLTEIVRVVNESIMGTAG